MRSILLNPHPAVLALGVLFSPESLTKLGNGVGLSGGFSIPLLLFATLVYFFLSSRYDHLQQAHSGPTVESRPLRRLLGYRVAGILPLVTRLPAFVCLGTAVLATSGFVFNEVFVYWFPNFAFAFLLLGLCLGVNLLSARVALALQQICVGVSMAGLFTLSLAAVIEGSLASFPKPTGQGTFELDGLVLCLALFMGCELSVYAPSTGLQERKPRPAARLTVMFCAALFLAWAAVSLTVVPLERLAESSLPHMLAARGIWGEMGRKIMGVVVLGGCCGLVNGSFLAIRCLVPAAIHPREIDDPALQGVGTGRLGVCLAAGAIAALLGAGLAGESRLEVWIRGSVILWLLGYVLFLLALSSCCFNELPTDLSRWKVFGHRAWSHVGLGILFLLLASLMVWSEPEKGELARMLLLAPSLSCIILVGWQRLAVSRSAED